MIVEQRVDYYILTYYTAGQPGSSIFFMCIKVIQCKKIPGPAPTRLKKIEGPRGKKEIRIETKNKMKLYETGQNKIKQNKTGLKNPKQDKSGQNRT